jgi:FKBP-type peptidyl-prolyl cis-trans isomerases 1
MKKSGLAVGLFMCFGWYACQKPTPQIPSNKVAIDNSESQSLLAINQNLTEKEDSLLKLYAKNSNSGLLKHENGFWYKIVQTAVGKKIIDKSVCHFTYKLSLINGKELESGNKKITVGKKEVIAGLNEGLKLLHYGDSAIFVIPWYLGYGLKGDGNNIPPYTSLVYQIRVSQ